MTIEQVKEEILRDWNRVSIYFKETYPLKIHWRPGNPTGFSSFLGVELTIPNDADWFFRGGGKRKVRHFLVHEAIHLFEELKHGMPKAIKVGFYSRMSRDTYSTKKIKEIFGESMIFDRRFTAVMELRRLLR